MPIVKNHRNSSGIALVTALMFTLIALGIIVGTYYIVHKSTELSGLFKRFQTANEAAMGAFEFFTKEFMRVMMQGQSPNLPQLYGNVFRASDSVNYTCLRSKLFSEPDANGYTNCQGDSTALNPTIRPDLIFHFDPFVVFLKITDTLEGNTDIGGVSLVGAGVVESGSNVISPPHIPYIYRIDILGQREFGAMERAWITGVYSY